MGIVLFLVAAYFFVGYLAVTGRIKPVHDLTDRNMLTDARHPAEWNALEDHLVGVFMTGPKDDYRAIMLRFALAINAMDADQQTVPSGLSCVIRRKMLYEYQRRTGSLYFACFDERTAMSGPEVLRPLSYDERPRFLEFCRLLDTRPDVTSTVVTSDHPLRG